MMIKEAPIAAIHPTCQPDWYVDSLLEAIEIAQGILGAVIHELGTDDGYAVCIHDE